VSEDWVPGGGPPEEGPGQGGGPERGPPGPEGPPVSPHWPLAIISFFFFWPLAIFACIYAARVKPALEMGDVAGAEKASNRVRTLFFISLGIAVLSWILIIAVVASGSNNPNQPPPPPPSNTSSGAIPPSGGGQSSSSHAKLSSCDRRSALGVVCVGRRNVAYAHEQPRLDARVTGRLSNNQKVQVQCAAQGDVVSFKGRSSSLWDGTVYGYIPDVVLRGERQGTRSACG